MGYENSTLEATITMLIKSSKKEFTYFIDGKEVSDIVYIKQGATFDLTAKLNGITIDN